MGDAQDRFALFIYEPHEASGGVNDLKHVGTMQECVDLARQCRYEECVQIARMDTLQVVASGEWDYRPPAVRGRPITWVFAWVQCPCCSA